MTIKNKHKFSKEDEPFMARALELAARGAGMVSPNPMVGAVVVRDGKILGEGYHTQVGKAHAEIEAFNNAGKANLQGATLYVTLEPCSHVGRTPACAPEIVKRGIKRVVVPHADPNPLVAGQGFQALKRAGIKVDVGLCEMAARRLNENFLTFHTLNRPFIIAKWAMTLDGRIASMTGQSKWITNEESRNHVHQIRSNVDAIMIGIGTVLQDNPLLNVRLQGYKKRQPKRIIVDGNLRIPLRAKCLTVANPGECIIATSEVAPVEKIEQLRAAGHHVLVLKGRRGIIDLRQLIAQLPDFEIQSILAEGGSSMHGSLLSSRMVDKIVAFVAPKVIGGDQSKTPISGWGLQTMADAMVLEDVRVLQFGTDVCWEGYVSDNLRDMRPIKSKGVIVGKQARKPSKILASR